MTRRPTLSVDEIHRELQLQKDQWMDLRTLRVLGKQFYHEKQMREQNPQLMELWESYQTMLKLVQEGNTNANV